MLLLQNKCLQGKYITFLFITKQIGHKELSSPYPSESLISTTSSNTLLYLSLWFNNLNALILL